MTTPSEEGPASLPVLPAHFERWHDSMEEVQARCRVWKEAARAERLYLAFQREAMKKLRLKLAEQQERLVEEQQILERRVGGIFANGG